MPQCLFQRRSSGYGKLLSHVRTLSPDQSASRMSTTFSCGMRRVEFLCVMRLVTKLACTVMVTSIHIRWVCLTMLAGKIRYYNEVSESHKPCRPREAEWHTVHTRSEVREERRKACHDLESSGGSVAAFSILPCLCSAVLYPNRTV
jgi:hypothetical protein